VHAISEDQFNPNLVQDEKSDAYEKMIFNSHELIIRETTVGKIIIFKPSQLVSLNARLSLVANTDYRQTILAQEYTPQPKFVGDDSNASIYN
jgi:hypothetical protein